jgi:[acyl-carrier-protein] S-malonyltransferase
LGKTGFIFPAFGERLAEKDIFFFNDKKDHFDNYLYRLNADGFAGIQGLMDSYDRVIRNELDSQIVAYAYSCALSDHFKNNGKRPDYVSGYSLGIYGALYNSGALTFNEGSTLIREVYNFIVEEIKGRNFGIAVIIGLERKDIDKILHEFESVDIINENNKYSFVIAGLADEMAVILDICINEGGINSKMLPINAPYHSRFVADSGDKFLEFLQKNVDVKTAEIPLISAIDQRIIFRKEDIEAEIAKNIKMKINWNLTMQKLISLECGTLVECGIGKSLLKIGKFIEGNFKILTFDKFNVK